jgi:DNA primase
MSNTTFNKKQWLRVRKASPCPICGKPDWCLISQDGKSVICARIESQKPAGKAGWIHNLENGITLPDKPIQPEKSLKKAPLEILDKTYNRLLSELRLSPIHKENLMKRGLSEDQITAFNFKSMPREDRSLVIKTLLNNNTQLEGIPGFWKDSLGFYHLSGPHGITIPVRDLIRRIVGIQIRCDDTSGGKYKWLSSAERPDGCSSGVSVHVARPENHKIDEIWITEGPLKADIACLKLQRIVLAIPGVACWNEAVPILCKLKIRRVVLALDMDKLTNEFVKLYQIQLTNRLLDLGFMVYEANWNSQFKGLDDILATGDIND